MHQPSMESSRRLGRRRFLRLAAGGTLGTAVATAGCLGGDSGADDPIEAIERYFEALENGDREAANRYAHEDGEYYLGADPQGILGDALDAKEITLSDPQEVSLDTAVENMFQNPEEDAELVADAIEAEMRAIGTLQDEYTFGDYAYVRHEASAEGLTFNPTFLLFESDGGWLIWSLPTMPPQQVEDLLLVGP